MEMIGPTILAILGLSVVVPVLLGSVYMSREIWRSLRDE